MHIGIHAQAFFRAESRGLDHGLDFGLRLGLLAPEDDGIRKQLIMRAAEDLNSLATEEDLSNLISIEYVRCMLDGNDQDLKARYVALYGDPRLAVSKAIGDNICEAIRDRIDDTREEIEVTMGDCLHILDLTNRVEITYPLA